MSNKQSSNISHDVMVGEKWLILCTTGTKQFSYNVLQEEEKKYHKFQYFLQTLITFNFYRQIYSMNGGASYT